MLYRRYQAQADLADMVRATARFSAAMTAPFAAFRPRLPLSHLMAGQAMLGRVGITHDRPSYRIKAASVGNREVPVTEEPVLRTPFGTLLHFAKDVDVPQPKVLVVAPLSGHFATLLRNTVQTLLADHDVYITDWHNARDVPLEDGPFGFDDYVEHLIRFLETMGPGSHVLAVCQPCVQVLAATEIGRAHV